MVWVILIPFTIKEILSKKNYIKQNFFIIGLMGILSISTFNSVVYFASKLYPSYKRCFNVSSHTSNDNNFFIDNEIEKQMFFKYPAYFYR